MDHFTFLGVIDVHNLQDVYAQFKTVFSQHAQGMVKTFTSIAKSIGFIAIVIIWGIDISKALASSTPINFTKYLYPMALGILLGSYSLIGSSLTAAAESVETKLVANSNGLTLSESYTVLLKKDSERYKYLADKYISSYEQEQQKAFTREAAGTDANAQQAVELLDKSKATEKSGVAAFFTETLNPQVWINKIVKYLAIGLGSIGYYILMIVSKFYLILLMAIGPLSIGISIIPAYSNSAANFFHKAVSYMLWVPLGGLINSSIASILARVGDTEDNALLILCIAVFQIVLYMQVPKVAHEVMMIGGGRQGTGISQAVTNTVVSKIS